MSKKGLTLAVQVSIILPDNRTPYKEWLRDGPCETRQPAQVHGGKSRSVHALADKV